jgi:hypothetical protein
MMRYFFLLIFIFSAILLPAESSAESAAFRIINGNTHYYSCLQEAFDDSSGESVDFPEKIFLLADFTVNEQLVVKDGKHITLIPEQNMTIRRGNNLLDFPVIWITGDNSSLTLGIKDMDYELTIDGGFLNTPSVQSHSPLIAVNGLNAKLIMYENVILQNNHNTGTAPVQASFYQGGAGVFVRTSEENFYHPAEFILKGGIIRANANRIQTTRSLGGGVTVYSGIFTMEGGTIMNNTALRTGGGVYISGTGSFKKTGGIIYGNNAPPDLRNTAFDYNSSGYFGHAVTISEIGYPDFFYRNDTINENEALTYTGSLSNIGVVGKGEKWHSLDTIFRRNIFLVFLARLKTS